MASCAEGGGQGYGGGHRGRGGFWMTWSQIVPDAQFPSAVL